MPNSRARWNPDPVTFHLDEGTSGELHCRNRNPQTFHFGREAL
ncbi:hypothetical protein Slin14017_G034400 [Septoria linicola]|nr:hypothetical protein Slin14017_G034400 [Septoria linicola]